MRASEIQPSKLVIFDIDDTLVHTQTKVHVIKNGQVVQSLNSHDFTHYKLQPGEEFDFGDFRNAKEFFEKSKPIIPMIDQLKHDIHTGNKVVMVTARADFDDRELFLDTFRKYGVDMSKVHVYRAGNMAGKMQTEEKKKIIIRNLLNNGHFTKAIMYDDALPNLHSFVELKQEYPATKFYAWHVSLEGDASEYSRTNESSSWQKSSGKNKNGGLNKKGVASYRREHPGSKLQTAVTTKPSKLKPGSKAAKRRKSFCARMSGMKKRNTSSKTAHDPNSRINKSLRKWNCESIEQLYDILETLKEAANPAQQAAIAISKKEKQSNENFADGKNPGRKGLAKRSGVNAKASVSSLRNTAKHSSGEKQRMAHWLANMKAGKAKK
jgi:hypothetical protein